MRGSKLHEQPVEPLHELGRIAELAALGELRLVMKDQRQLLEARLVSEAIEMPHQRMSDIELERRFRLRDALARGGEDPAHAGPEVVLTQHQTSGGVGQARAHPHLRDPLADRILDPLEQALALLQLLVMVLAVRLALECPELEIAARGILEALAREAVDVTHE